MGVIDKLNVGSAGLIRNEICYRRENVKTMTPCKCRMKYLRQAMRIYTLANLDRKYILDENEIKRLMTLGQSNLIRHSSMLKIVSNHRVLPVMTWTKAWTATKQLRQYQQVFRRQIYAGNQNRSEWEMYSSVLKKKWQQAGHICSPVGQRTTGLTKGSMATPGSQLQAQ